MLLVLTLMAAYLSIMVVLAVTVDRQYLLNDAIALVVFSALLGGLLLIERRSEVRPTEPT